MKVLNYKEYERGSLQGFFELALESGEYKKARSTAIEARNEAMQAQKDVTATSTP